MSCSNCGPGCGGPCTTPETSTVAYETLPSQIDNFTKSFFGEVQKVVVDGAVTWVLPCDLDIGLDENPRAENEGLACYFLRLFREGITGYAGPQGEPGTPGDDGAPAFTSTTQAFTQPTLMAPVVQLSTSYVPIISAGMVVFVTDSGWYEVLDVTTIDAISTLTLSLLRAVDGATGTIPSGRMVTPSGPPGLSGATGATGAQGPQGPAGAAGASWPSSNVAFTSASGTDFQPGVSFAKVDFTATVPAVVLPTAGTYLISGSMQVKGLTGVAVSDVVDLKLRNGTAAADLAGTARSVTVLEDEVVQVPFSTIYTSPGTNQSIEVFAKCVSASKTAVVAGAGSLTAIRIA